MRTPSGTEAAIEQLPQQAFRELRLWNAERGAREWTADGTKASRELMAMTNTRRWTSSRNCTR